MLTSVPGRVFFINDLYHSGTILQKCLEGCRIYVTFASDKTFNFMAYTKETMVIKNPSEKLLKVIEEMRKHKLAQVERLRNMKPEEFSRRVILS